MPLESHLIVLVLVAAVLHAGWNALIKTGRDRLLGMALVQGAGSLVAAPLLFLVAVPAVESWPYLGASIVLHMGYFFFLIQAYRVGDLSHVYPLARGSAPLMVAAGAAVFAGEGLDPVALGGLMLASAGITSLIFGGGGGGEQGRDWRPILFAMGTAVFIAAYTVVDGLGVRLSGSPLGYIAWLMFLESFGLVIYTLWRRPGELGPFIKAHGKSCFAGGVMCVTAYGLVIRALNSGPMAYVSAVRETSVLFAALIGTRVLGESFGARRVIAAVVVVVGIVIMNLGG